MKRSQPIYDRAKRQGIKFIGCSRTMNEMLVDNYNSIVCKAECAPTGAVKSVRKGRRIA